MEKTKTECFMRIKDIIADSACETAEKEELYRFIDNEIDIIKKKAERERKHGISVKVYGDALRDQVEVLLTDEYQALDDLTDQINKHNPDVTRTQVAARLTSLIRNDIAEKTTYKRKGHHITAYRLVQ